MAVCNARGRNREASVFGHRHFVRVSFLVCLLVTLMRMLCSKKCSTKPAAARWSSRTFCGDEECQRELQPSPAQLSDSPAPMRIYAYDTFQTGKGLEEGLVCAPSPIKLKHVEGRSEAPRRQQRGFLPHRSTVTFPPHSVVRNSVFQTDSLCQNAKRQKNKCSFRSHDMSSNSCSGNFSLSLSLSLSPCGVSSRNSRPP